MVAGGLVMVASKISPFTVSTTLSLLGSLKPKSKHKVSPSTTVKLLSVVPAAGSILGAGLGGQLRTNNCRSLLVIPTMFPLELYSVISTATT